MDQKTLLRAIPYFNPLADPALEQVMRQVVMRKCQAGEIIFLENDPNAGLYLVVEGLCKVYRVSAEGREYILTTLHPGDSCNEVPVVDSGPNPANFAAIEDSTLWVISGDSMTYLRQAYPELNNAIIKNLAMRCRQLVQRVYNLTFLPVTGRLAAFLLQQKAEDNEISRRWTQDEIAAHLGTVREMVGRAFRELQQAQLIAINRHQIEILDEEGLRQLT